MRNDHTPPGTISFLDLVELFIKWRHGNDAVAEVTIHEVGKGKKRRIVVERAGKRIDYETNCKRWDDARESIRQKCYEGELTAYVFNPDGENLKISRKYWETVTPETPASDCHWYTQNHGRFRSSDKKLSIYNEGVVFFKKCDADPGKEEPNSLLLSASIRGKKARVRMKVMQEIEKSLKVSGEIPFGLPSIVKKYLEDEGLPMDAITEKTIKNWVPQCRKKAGVPGKPGRPKKKQ